MPACNCIQLVGNLTKAPELKTTANGRQIATFRIATNSKFKNKEGELCEDTVFIDVETWGKMAEVVNRYLHKGSRVFVIGYLRQSRWQDKDTGQNKSRIYITSSSVQFLSRPPRSSTAQDSSTQQEAAEPGWSPPQHDLPF